MKKVKKLIIPLMLMVSLVVLSLLVVGEALRTNIMKMVQN